MDFTLQFLKIFVLGVYLLSPLFIFLSIIIIGLGLVIGKKENWSKFDAVYYAFITATTVGFGDFRPKYKISKIFSVIVAIVGLIFTGILIAVALEAAMQAFESNYDVVELEKKFK